MFLFLTGSLNKTSKEATDMTYDDYSISQTTFPVQTTVNQYWETIRVCADWFYVSQQEDNLQPQTGKKKDIPDSTNLNGSKVLLVDDNREIRELLATFLSEYGLIIVQASNGLEAIRQFNQDQFDIILTDICMPGMNGNILTKQIKNITRNMPVIAITGSPALVEKHFDKVLTKPVKLSSVLESVQTCLAKPPVHSAVTGFRQLKNKFSNLKKR